MNKSDNQYQNIAQTAWIKALICFKMLLIAEM